MTNQKLFKVIDLSAFICLLLTTIFVPLFLDKRLANLYIIPKQYVLVGLVLLCALLFVAKVVLSKKILFRSSILDVPLLGFVLIALAASFFSANIYDSFFGRSEYFVFNFLFLLFLVLFYFLLANFLSNPRRWSLMINFLVGVGGMTAMLFVLKMIFNFDLLSPWYASAWNTIDKMNSLFGVWLITIFVVSAGKIIRKNLSVGKAIFYFFISVLCFTSLVLLSFNVLWWILLLGLVLLLLLGVSFVREARLGWLSVLFALLILTTVFIAFGTPKVMQSALPAEVSLGVSPSWNISYNTVVSGAKNFLIGTGPGSFSVNFSRFRPVSFNYDDVAWSLRFGQPFSTFLSLVAEGGALMTLIFVFIILFVIGHVFHAWLKTKNDIVSQNFIANFGVEKNDVRLDVFLMATAWVILTVSMAVVFFNPVLWWLWWLLLGLVISGLSFIISGIIKQKEWTMEDSPQYSLSFSFVLIVIMAAVVMLGVWGARLYIAEIDYSESLRSQNYSTAESKLRSALLKRNNADIYHAALAQIYLLEAVNIGKEDKADIQKVSSLVASAVNEAKIATDLSPRSVSLWENLAAMYESASALVPEARQWVIKSLTQAKDLEPTNPVLFWRLGNNYGLDANWEEAEKNYKQAIELKKDYASAYVSLAGVYEQTKKIDQAIETHQKVLLYAPQNSEALFNFGRLLYNRNKDEDRNNAEKLWLEAVRIQPNYSNALYSLGLLYENKGDKSTALRYYYKVKDLNPDNKDISDKIKNIIN